MVRMTFCPVCRWWPIVDENADCPRCRSNVASSLERKRQELRSGIQRDLRKYWEKKGLCPKCGSDKHFIREYHSDSKYSRGTRKIKSCRKCDADISVEYVDE